MATTVLNFPVELIEHECISCGVKFAMPKHLDERRRETHDSFYCPNGHAASYTAKNNRDIVKEFRGVLERISNLESGLFNKHTLELAIELAKNTLKDNS